MKNRVLVAGASGKLGQNIVKNFKLQGYCPFTGKSFASRNRFNLLNDLFSGSKNLFCMRQFSEIS
jgi:hypothetical protein